MSTICAIATPNAVGGISVIRISGDKAIEIAAKIFQPFGEKIVEKMDGYSCCYGKIVDGNNIVDDGILTIFRAPHSYTGEDVAEISCHGGIYVTREVLRVVIKNGATPAREGEFSKIAFLNGKLSLTQAESVIDLIMAQSEQAYKFARVNKQGNLFKKVEGIKIGLVRLLGELWAWVDYPEEDLPEVEAENLSSTLSSMGSDIEKILATYDSGRIFREGISTAIVGKPNVGKSTLMNLLVGFKRSIVTDIAGTTRDVVEERVKVGDVILNLSDTAGIRETGDVVEKIGVELSQNKIEESDLVIAVFDNSQKLSAEDFSILEKIKDANHIIVINKTDLDRELEIKKIREFSDSIIEITATQSLSERVISKKIEEVLNIKQITDGEAVVSSERQKDCLEGALELLKRALEAVKIGESYDGVTILLDECTKRLMELTGENITDAVVDEIFSKFCVGK